MLAAARRNNRTLATSSPSKATQTMNVWFLDSKFYKYSQNYNQNQNVLLNKMFISWWVYFVTDLNLVLQQPSTAVLLLKGRYCKKRELLLPLVSLKISHNSFGQSAQSFQNISGMSYWVFVVRASRKWRLLINSPLYIVLKSSYLSPPPRGAAGGQCRRTIQLGKLFNWKLLLAESPPFMKSVYPLAGAAEPGVQWVQVHIFWVKTNYLIL